jgi:membrane dipeptidase
MSDEMIRLLAAKGGVIQVNFGSYFIKDSYRMDEEHQEKLIGDRLKALGLKAGDAAAAAYERRYRQENPIPVADVRDVADHIDHVVRLAGIDHVGLGSDFDGVGDSLPTRLKDVSDYPNLIYELLARGYTDDDIRKICGANLLRVWSAVERLAAQAGPGG